MNNREELDVIQQSIVRLRADVNAQRFAIEAVMAGLPYLYQRQLLQHLHQEAAQMETNFHHQDVPQHAQALRALARTLDSWHIRQQQQQWAESASPETDPGSPHPTAQNQ